MEKGQRLSVEVQNKLKCVLASVDNEGDKQEINNILQGLDLSRQEKLINFLSINKNVIESFKSADLPDVLNVFKNLDLNYRIGLIDVLNENNGQQLNLYEEEMLINVLNRLDETDKRILIDVLYQSNLDKKREYISQLNWIRDEQPKLKEAINSINIDFYQTKHGVRPIQMVNQNNSQGKNEINKKQPQQTKTNR